MCEPNPCAPGHCTVNDKQSIECNCQGTYTIGERCQLGYIVIDSVPALINGNREIVTMSSQPRTQITISITSSNQSSLSVNTPIVSLSPQSHGASYIVQANDPGLFRVSYDIMPDSSYVKPDDSILMVASRERVTRAENSDYFTTQGLQRGQLGIGCCSKEVTLSQYQCSSNLTLHSYCQWNEVTSPGVVHLSVASLYLPVSIAGLDLKTSPLSLNTHYSAEQCLSCDKTPNQRCQKLDSSLIFSINTLKGILQYRSIVNSFLNSVRDFLPSWLTIDIHSTTFPSSYSLYDFMTFIGEGREVRGLTGCNQFELPDTPSLLYALRTTSRLLVTIDSHPTFLYPQASNPFCVVIDACSGMTPTLHSLVPPKLVSKETIGSTGVLSLLLAGNAQVNFRSISLQENGILPPLGLHNKDGKAMYWNGSLSFSPILPSLYQYKLTADYRRTFTGGNNLIVDLNFKGSVYYQPKIKEGQVSILI